MKRLAKYDWIIAPMIFCLMGLSGCYLNAQAQSYYDSETPYIKIYKENFNNEFEARKNPNTTVLTPEAGSFTEGNVLLDGTTTNIDVSLIIPDGTYCTYRFKCRITDVTPPSTNYFIDFRKDGSGNTHLFSWLSNSTLSNNGLAAAVKYINGVVSSDISGLEDEWIDVVYTGQNVFPISIGSLGRYSGGTTNSQIDFDLVEVYLGAMTAEEVLNLYNDDRYQPVLTSQAEELADDIPRTFIPGNGNPVINGDTVILENGVQSHVVESSYWEVGKTYRVKGEVLAYQGTPNRIILPYASEVSQYASGVGSFDYYYIPTSTVMYIYSYDNAGGTVYVESIQEVTEGESERILHVTSNRGFIEDKEENTVSITDVEVVKDGSTWVPYFDALTTKIGFSPAITKTVSENLTISLWYKADSWDASPAFVGRASIATTDMIFATPTAIYFETSVNGDIAYASMAGTLHEWKHLVVVKEGSNVRIYEDGVALTMIDGTIANSVVLDQIGMRGPGNGRFKGNITDVRFEAGAWSDEKVSQEYTSTKKNYVK